MSSDSGEHADGDKTATDLNAGARWWSVDIHAHSPASFDFGGLEGTASEEPKPSFKEWVQAYVDAGLDGIVVADHNSHLGIDQARQALAELREADPTVELTIFPGVELTAHGGTHVLVIADPLAEPEVINRVITLAGFSGELGRSDQTTAKTVLDIASIVEAEGCICIPAHADQRRGLFELDPRDLAPLASSGFIKAVEIIDDDNLAKAGSLGWAAVLGSDAHHLTTAGCPPTQIPKAPGTHFTRVKCGTLNLGGLRLALTDPERSLMRCRSGDADPNHVSHDQITSISLTHAGSTATYAFSPWMTCLIGGRGVGKSMILELIRLALGRSGELQGSVAGELHRYSPSADEEHRWWSEETEIVVDYQKDGRPLRARWTGARAHEQSLETSDGTNWTPQAGAVSDRAPVRVFSQKQIFELASSPQSLLAIVDDMPEIQKDNWRAEYQALRLKYKTERGQLRQLLAEAGKSERTKGQLEEVQGRLAKLAAVQEAPEYAELTQTEARIIALKEIEGVATEVEANLAEIEVKLRDAVPEELDVVAYAARASGLTEAANAVGVSLAALRTTRAEFEASGISEAWAGRVTGLSAWVAAQVGGESDASAQILQDRRREAELVAELAAAESATAQVEELESQLEITLAQVRSKRDELFERRKEYVDALSSRDTTVQVRVFRQGQTDGLESELRALLSRPDAFDSAFAGDGLARDLVAANPMTPGYSDEVDRFKSQLVNFVAVGRDSEIGKRLKADNRFFTHVSGLDPYDVATEVMLWYPEDRLEVRYRPRPGANFEPVDRGSPGQRTAALLAVILKMGSEPLLLDQPEDDLENKLIKSLIVESLKSIKSARQVVVATHNANVVVTSGAENIIILEHGALPSVEARGTLESKPVREAVCLILEGGEDAIKSRYERLVEPARR